MYANITIVYKDENRDDLKISIKLPKIDSGKYDPGSDFWDVLSALVARYLGGFYGSFIGLSEKPQGRIFPFYKN